MNELEKKFHTSRVAFMYINDEILYLENSSMGHIDWYKSLGYDENNFNNIVRGYYKNGRIIFYKGDFIYDDETIICAEKIYKDIMVKVNDMDAEVWVGVLKGEVGKEWEPIKRIH